MKELLLKLSSKIVFESSVQILTDKKGIIIINNSNYPASGIPARELKILVNVVEFRKMQAQTGELVFFYELNNNDNN